MTHDELRTRPVKLSNERLAKFVARLDALNLQINGYGDFPDHAVYMAGLREWHRRKHAFWRRVKETG